MQNIQCEINALSYLMERRDPQLFIAISTEYFGNKELAKVYLLIKRFYLEHTEFPGWDLLRSMVSRACKSADVSRFMSAILDQAQERDITGLTDEILLRELKDYHRFRTVLTKVEPLVQAVEIKDISTVLTRLKELYDSVFVQDECKLEDADVGAVARQKVKFQFRKTGIAPIDIRGGLIIGGYTLIAAYAKTGKSTVAAMIALFQYLFEEGSVAYFSFEMGKAEVYARVLANFADIDLGDLLADRLNETDRRRLFAKEAEFLCGLRTGIVDFVEANCHLNHEEFIDLLLNQFPQRSNRFYIFDERTDYQSLLVKMDLLATTRNVKLFVIDYPWLLSRGAAFPGMQDWHYQLEVSKGWKTFAHNHQVCVITPAQLDPGKKGEDPRLKFVTNAINDTDLTLFLTRTNEDKILETTTFSFAAWRNFLSVPGEGFPAPFKMANELNKSRFSYTEF